MQRDRRSAREGVLEPFIIQYKPILHNEVFTHLIVLFQALNTIDRKYTCEQQEVAFVVIAYKQKVG